MSAREDIPSGDIWVVYDGQCPFCSSYVLLYRLRALAGLVHLIDARSDHPLVEAIRQHGYDLDAGMAVAFGGRIYWGAEAMNVLALLGSGSTIFNRLNRLLFRRIGLARLLYPILVRGRMLTLRLLGRGRIGKG
ncbi:MAG TPA: DCC1-like thiol-disulfide oxidoreductase family protein [Rhizomicrobium sp.]|nr:DCC1-like thiol-disulfide oxidoreductase family protein [Rhizomicrobium sp.]